MKSTSGAAPDHAGDEIEDEHEADEEHEPLHRVTADVLEARRVDEQGDEREEEEEQ